MTRDLDPTLEAAARQRLRSLADAIDVPRAVGEGGLDPVRPAGAHAAHGWLRRRAVLGGLAAGAAAAVVVSVVLVADAGGPDTVADETRDEPGTASGPSDAPASSTTLSPGGPTACTSPPPIVADGVIASGPTPSGGTWEARVHGEPPNIGTNLMVDGDVAGGGQYDMRSRAPLVNEGIYDMSARVSPEGGIVEGMAPRETVRVEVVTESGAAVTTCPVWATNDELVAWFGLSLAAGERPVTVRALDGAGQALAEGSFPWSTPVGVLASVRTYLRADPSLVTLPLGGTAFELPPPTVLTDLVTGEIPSGSWSVAAGMDGEVVEFELRLPAGMLSRVWGTVAEHLGDDPSWQVDRYEQHVVAWGPLPEDVDTVVATFHDGTTAEVSAVSVPGAAMRVFALAMPADAGLVDLDGRRADGTTSIRAVDLVNTIAIFVAPDATRGGGAVHTTSG